jgi:hypothetical protein
MLGDGDNVGASDLGDGNTAVGLVGCVQIDMVRANAGGDGELQVLGLGQALGSQVAGVEAIELRQPFRSPRLKPHTLSLALRKTRAGSQPSPKHAQSVPYLRCGNDNFGIDQLLVEGRVLALLIGSGDESVALVLEPFSDAELVLGRSQQRVDLFGVLAAVVQYEQDFDLFTLGCQ